MLSPGVTGGHRNQNAEVEHGSTSATGDWVAGPVSIEMWSMIFAGTTCSPCHVDPSSGLHCHFATFILVFVIILGFHKGGGLSRGFLQVNLIQVLTE